MTLGAGAFDGRSGGRFDRGAKGDLLRLETGVWIAPRCEAAGAGCLAALGVLALEFEASALFVDASPGLLKGARGGREDCGEDVEERGEEENGKGEAGDEEEKAEEETLHAIPGTVGDVMCDLTDVAQLWSWCLVDLTVDAERAFLQCHAALTERVAGHAGLEGLPDVVTECTLDQACWYGAMALLQSRGKAADSRPLEISTSGPALAVDRFMCCSCDAVKTQVMFAVGAGCDLFKRHGRVAALAVEHGSQLLSFRFIQLGCVSVISKKPLLRTPNE